MCNSIAVRFFIYDQCECPNRMSLSVQKRKNKMMSLVSMASEVPVQMRHDTQFWHDFMVSFCFNGYIFNFYSIYIILYIIYCVDLASKYTHSLWKHLSRLYIQLDKCQWLVTTNKTTGCRQWHHAIQAFSTSNRLLHLWVQNVKIMFLCVGI